MTFTDFGRPKVPWIHTLGPRLKKPRVVFDVGFDNGPADQRAPRVEILGDGKTVIGWLNGTTKNNNVQAEEYI